MNSKVLFFIPARGGSKGLPGKNIKKLNGFPLLYWTIKAAIESGIKGDIVVSTDDKKIAKIALKYGAKVPFLRPKELAQDSTPTMDVIKHFYKWSAAEGIHYDTLIVLQPTSPLRIGADIAQANKLFKKLKCDSVATVCKCSFNPAWVNTLPDNMNMKDFLPKKTKNANRQQYPQHYELNGAVTIANFSKLLKAGTVYTNKTFAFEMPSSRSVDIDTETDFVLAKYWMKKNKNFYKKS
jgi:CMP-N,N'-diacetyllegionaminic acid synthase